MTEYDPRRHHRLKRLAILRPWRGAQVWIVACLAIIAASALSAAEPKQLQRGDVRYEPLPGGPDSGSRFALPAHSFSYEEEMVADGSPKVTVSYVTFPSAVTTPVEANNTVHCEYYRPKREGRVPGVVVLHILGGDFPLSRMFCNALALRGTAALFVKMPYYGPRRGPGVERRMISKDPAETVEGMTQAILDVKRGAAWLAARPEIDPEQLGIFGISLGGITGALAATAEPRLHNVCLLLAGGDIGRVAWESPEVAEVREYWIKKGGSRDAFFALMKEVDPVTYAASMRGRRILMLNATDDEVIPRACTESLWKAFGEPEIVWYSGGHYSVGRHIFDAMVRVTQFFEPK